MLRPLLLATLDNLLELRGIDRQIQGHDIALKALDLGSLVNASPSTENCEKGGDMLAAVVLSGIIGNIGQFSIIKLGEIAHQLLKHQPTSISTRVVYAFLLSASQKQEAIDTLTLAMESLDMNSSDKRIYSRLLSMRGWLKRSQEDLVSALKDYQHSFQLDPQHTLALFHACELRASLLAGKEKGNIDMASSTIQDIYRFILLNTDYPTLEPSLLELDRVLDLAKSVKHVDPGFLMALFILLEVWFRRGPRGGISLSMLAEAMNKIMTSAMDIKSSLMHVCEEKGYTLKSSEMDMIQTASQRAHSTVQGVVDMLVTSTSR